MFIILHTHPYILYTYMFGSGIRETTDYRIIFKQCTTFYINITTTNVNFLLYLMYFNIRFKTRETKHVRKIN